jgi:two-component system response regulator PilR (NtrC family)
MKGAFTGAVQTKQGLFEAASGGTLFLDEIGELSQPLQVKLLRALQERSIRRVGDTVDRKVDVRIVSATNRNLEEEVAAGRFREDVYYRLNVIQLTLPPLRDRLEDIPLLAQHFIRVFAEEMGKTVEGMDDKVYEVLAGYGFPGNVRELENLIERAVALTRVPIIGRDMLPETVTRSRETRPTARITEQGVDLEALVADYERSLLREALLLSGGVKKRAARLVGVSFRSFRYRVEKLGIEDSNRES